MKRNEELGMMEFDEKVVVGTVKVEMKLTEADIENIIVTGFEGGISYWAKVDRDKNESWLWNKPKDEPLSTWATKALIEGKTVIITDKEDDDEENADHVLTLKKLLDGFRDNYIERPHDNDLENGDATTSDCIIQYALFRDVVYG